MKYMAMMLTASCVLSAPVEANAADATLVTVKTPRGVSQPFLFAAPDRPKAAVILFVGGNGALRITGSGHVTNYGQNFLIRSFGDFVNKGLMVALVDVPSRTETMSAKFRLSKQHAGDMIAIVKYMNNKADVPVWLVGHSRGTYSAAGVAIKIRKRLSGLVLASTVTRDSPKKLPEGVLSLKLRGFKKPVLILAHKGDGCSVTPPANASKLKATLSQSPRVEIAMLAGGHSPKSDPCESLSEHGFYGIESGAVDRIAKFITQ